MDKGSARGVREGLTGDLHPYWDGELDLGPDVDAFCNIIEPVLTEGTVSMIEAPLWHYFERANPGPGPLLPGSDELID